jgi:uncharacterized 2Fe-2S/4Fe-4S cluster protein (DUF4445 family)
VIAGKVSPISLEEEACLTAAELQQGYRLACMTYPLSDVKLHVPPESLTALQRTQVEGLEVSVEPDPPVRSYELHLQPPTLESPQSDSKNLWAALTEHGFSGGTIDFQVQRELSTTIRENNWQVCAALRQDEVVAVGAPQTRWLGLAVDIGTTKIAGYLVDMHSGHTLAAKGLMNPQISYGEDVVSRIVAATKSPEDTARLQSVLSESLNQIAADLCAEISARPTDIVEAVVVGNTALHHFFLGLSVKQLGLSPYVPAVHDALDIKAREVGLSLATGAYVHLLPNIAGYVGADHVAMLLATRLADVDAVTMAIDIGTNTEICLNVKGRMTSVSCASGPAFEGAHIKFGMRAAPGAIEYVRLENDHLEIQTIAGEPPVGICGSGLLDIVAQLRLQNVIDRNGRMKSHALSRLIDGKPEFVLAERPGLSPITLSQKDVRELQLAKAAIRLGIQALVEAEGLVEQDLEHVIIAGAFGTFIDIQSAITIGMLPDLPLDRYQQVGNAAGTGARLALISSTEREKAEEIARRDGYIELGKIPEFSRKFAQVIYL